MHIAGHACGSLQHLAHGQRTQHNEGLVDTHEFLNPRIDKQVVANGYLYRIHTLVYQKNGQETGIENNVAMIGDIGIRRRLVCRQRGMVQSQSIRSLLRQFPQKPIAEGLLKFQLGFTRAHFLRPDFKRYTRHHSIHCLPERRIGNQFLIDLRKFLIMIRTDFIKFHVRIHNE